MHQRASPPVDLDLDLDLVAEMQRARVGLEEIWYYARTCLDAEERELLAWRLASHENDAARSSD